MSARVIPAATASMQQNQASDPAVSAWVSANAGAGKTHVLAQRVIRLLLDGVDPSKILCLTFTKAAAANMANRVFTTLATGPRSTMPRSTRRSPRPAPSAAARASARGRAGCSPRRSTRRAG